LLAWRALIVRWLVRAERRLQLNRDEEKDICSSLVDDDKYHGCIGKEFAEFNQWLYEIALMYSLRHQSSQE
jgi:hypothetical protein